jgi:murein DD-endopeptidase MepM/ murein hydrolase activator NlpD
VGDAVQVINMVSRAVPLGDIQPGTRIDITLGRRSEPGTPRPLDALAFRARFDLELALERRGGGLVLDPRPISVDETPLRIRGKVGYSLYRSARASGAPVSAVQQYLRTLNDSMRIDSDIQSSDEFDIIVSYKRAATGETQPGQLLYAGLDRGGKPVAQLLRWGKDGRFFEASGVGEQRSGLLQPVSGRITSGFGMRRHPILGYSRMHSGVDFQAGYGTPIYAVSDGAVTFAGRHGGHGNYVRLNHGGSFGTGYGHMSRIAVEPGDQVRRGQVIGYVGSTGLSIGPHLHYEVYRSGQAVNPMSVQFVTRAQLEGEELKQFRARLAALKLVAPGAALTPIAQETVQPSGPMREIDRLTPRRPGA